MLPIDLIPALSDNYIYYDPTSAFIVDPGECDPVFRFLEANSFPLKFILLTHHHGDHVDGALEIKRRTNAQIVAFEEDRFRLPPIDIAVKDGDEILLGSRTARIIHIPGHTLGHIAYYFSKDELLFTGDTLFSLGCGRLFEGTPEQMVSSLKKLMTLPPTTKIYCGHEYTEKNSRFALTLKPEDPALQDFATHIRELRAKGLPTLPTLLSTELKLNPFLRILENENALETFIKLRQMRNTF